MKAVMLSWFRKDSFLPGYKPDKDKPLRMEKVYLKKSFLKNHNLKP
jgi:hypothetical protein